MAWVGGTKGRFKASGREFKVVATTSSSSTIRFRFERQTFEIADAELDKTAEVIADWTERPEARA